MGSKYKKTMKEDFIKSALLGTAKYTPTYQLDGTDLSTLIPSDDKEDAFLKQAASAFLLSLIHI